MSTFEGAVLSQTIQVGREHKIEPAALLAVVEVESAGKSMDGSYPCLLFERHIFYRELKKAGGDLARAVANGLANSSWQPKTQYKDQGTSARRVALFERAAAINRECAIRSCSWGVGQTMGFLAEEMHFKNAVEMLAYMRDGGVPAQVECMVREIENKRLTAKLNGHQWAAFAKVYNGPGYAQNSYDTKMASAYSRWSKAALASVDVMPAKPTPPLPTKPPDSKGNVIAKNIAIGTAAGAGTGALVAAKTLPWDWIILGGFIIALAIIGGIVIWRRKYQPQQLGVLADTEVKE